MDLFGLMRKEKTSLGAQKAIETINREASSEGLTKKIEKLLEK